MCCNWRKVEPPMEGYPIHIDYEKDNCYYARERYTRRGFEGGTTNQLITNFKHDLSKNPHVKYYKDQAINKFAHELSVLFDSNRVYYLSFIPSSTCKTDSHYDHRMEDTLTALIKLRPKIIIEEPIVIINTVQPSHLGGTRDINEIKANYRWVGIKSKSVDRLFIIDDVLTKGSHFKAYQELVNQNYKEISIYGLFWARSIDPRGNPVMHT